jgi:hypothetical protein
VRHRLPGPLRAIGREVTAVLLLDCQCTPDDCPCDDWPPGCC